ncbi:unnamed protein product, partial [Larinioides sclopetarius]
MYRKISQIRFMEFKGKEWGPSEKLRTKPFVSSNQSRDFHFPSLVYKG